MSINPIETTNNIRNEYIEYLKSMFLFKNNKLRKSAENAIDSIKNELVIGPYIEAEAIYKKGNTIKDLIEKKVLCEDFERLIPSIGNFNLYLHQENAIKKVIRENKNIIISSGTGSGKTESFLIPILNHIIKEKSENKLSPGIRALIVYPMNALANDQLKRLRSLLKDYPEITFGRYTGDTQEREEKAINEFKKLNPDEKIIPNEMLSREKMRRNPPHIFLTNFAMLEYLLLRPKDNVFFDGENSEHWKYVVFDEAHVYSGSLGTEISYLVARLKDRLVEGEKNKLKFIATSATLGGKTDTKKEIIKYAKDIFNEDFTLDSLILSEKVELAKPKNLLKPKDINIYSQIFKIYVNSNLEEFIDEINKLNIYNRITNAESKNQALYYILNEDYYAYKIKETIKNETKRIKQAIIDVFGLYNAETSKNFLNLVELAAKAKKEKNAASIIPARYHTFTKAIEGAFIQLYPKEKIYLNRKKIVQNDKERISIFEIANCQKCGQEYIIGKIENGKIVQSSGYYQENIENKLEYFLLEENFKDIKLNEDTFLDIESDLTNGKKEMNKAEELLLCVKCGTIHKVRLDNHIKCCEQPKLIIVYRVEYDKRINTCLSCGSYQHSIIKRMINADAPTTEMLSRTLYQNIESEKSDVEHDRKTIKSNSLFGDITTNNNLNDMGIEKERKLLAFSDSRKDAAYFSTYMDIRYNSYLWRKIIFDEINEIEDDHITFKKLKTKIKKSMGRKRLSLIKPNEDFDEKISAYLMYELLSYEKNIGLEGLGMISLSIGKPSWWTENHKYEDFSSEEFWGIIENILHGLRINRAVDYPDDLNYNHPIFGARANERSFRFSDTETKKGIMSIKPKENYSNMRYDYLLKILNKRNYTIEEAKNISNDFLEKTFNDSNFLNGLIDSHILVSKDITGEGKVFKINHNAIRINNNKPIYYCDKCGKKTTVNINNVCPTYRCDGILKLVEEKQKQDLYYINLYENIKKIPMNIKEHTAQLTTKHASEIQRDFEKGKVNILSCSTTFEMGVDVGTLDTVFLRNIPPETSNYVQRAGRAGRKLSSTAYILTYAKRRSHDLYYFNHPNKIIEGEIKAPYIEKNNEKIAFRHLNSVVFSWIFRKNDKYFENVQKLLAYEENYNSIDEELRIELSNKPEEIYKSLKNILTDELYQTFNINNWAWVSERLLNENGNLSIAKHKWIEEITEIKKIREDNFSRNRPVDMINRMLKTYLEKRVIDFLGSNNILPRYGFPIDSVNLDTIHPGKESSEIELSRDLKMAISEFAPGNKVIANGLVWESYSLNVARGKSWPTYIYSICEGCNRVYKENSDFKQKYEEILNKEKYCECGMKLKYRKFIKPIFGFSTNNKKPEEPKLSKPKSSYSSKVFFDKYDETEKNYKGEICINEYKINYAFSPRGNLFLVNQGKGDIGFFVCEACGYATNDFNIGGSHDNKYGRSCYNKYMQRVDLGHEIITDIIEIELPDITLDEVQDRKDEKSLYYSTLYALIEGAVSYLGISRGEIDGCLNYDSNSYNPKYILYDQVPGGAGHVKKISENLDNIIRDAMSKVNGICGCGEETSCYGCLRNYSNQYYHDILRRGFAYKYLKEINKPH